MSVFDIIVGNYLSIIEDSYSTADKLCYIDILYDFLCDNIELLKDNPELFKSAVICLRKFVFIDGWKDGKAYLRRLCPNEKIPKSFSWSDYEIKIMSGPDSTSYIPNYLDCKEEIELRLPMGK